MRDGRRITLLVDVDLAHDVLDVGRRVRVLPRIDEEVADRHGHLDAERQGLVECGEMVALGVPVVEMEEVDVELLGHRAEVAAPPVCVVPQLRRSRR